MTVSAARIAAKTAGLGLIARTRGPPPAALSLTGGRISACEDFTLKPVDLPIKEFIASVTTFTAGAGQPVVQWRQSGKEEVMRLVLIAVLVVAELLAASLPASACPAGYAPCGTRYCCPR
jgi:hypothetical protein